MKSSAAYTDDQRQSETAARVCRGARRLLRAHGIASLTEMPLPSGRRADIVGVASGGELIIIEVKSSVADFRADRKWPEYRSHCDQLYFAVPEGLPQDPWPQDAGLIIADAYGAEFIRTAPVHRLAPATRRAMLLRFGCLAAERLHLLSDTALQA